MTSYNYIGRLMNKGLIGSPSFGPAQQVSFLGGEGSVKSLRYEAETWFYIVEMTPGPEPDFGRVGGETTILLSEADLYEA